MNPRDFVGIALAAGLIAVAVVSQGWAVLASSIVAGMCIGFVGWDIWRSAHPRH